MYSHHLLLLQQLQHLQQLLRAASAFLFLI
jgi:hypothetical protein